jgi:hypothetical protein
MLDNSIADMDEAVEPNSPDIEPTAS